MQEGDNRPINFPLVKIPEYDMVRPLKPYCSLVFRWEGIENRCGTLRVCYAVLAGMYQERRHSYT